MMRRAFALCLVFFATAADAQTAPAGYALVSPARAEALAATPDSPARAALLRAADRALAQPASKARERVHVEGTLPGQGIYDESADALRELPAIRDLAFAARLTGQARYADKAASFLERWLELYRVSFNPIDETAFDNLFVAWEVLPEAQRAPRAQAMARMLRRFAQGYLDNPLRGQTATNNWNSHRTKLIALAAFATGDADLIARARAAFEAQLGANIRGDGSTVDFALRDAVHYVTYSLEPLAMAAFAARQHGENWTALADSALARGFAWIAPYADGSKSHAEFVNSREPFDRRRAEAGVPGFAGPFDRRKTRLLMALAARLDPAYLPIARELRTEVWQESWLEVLYPLGSP